MLALILTRAWSMTTHTAGFSPVYALVFCSGVYLGGAWHWLVPFVTLLVSDILLNVFYYEGVAPMSWFMLPTYLGYGILFLLGRKLGATSKFSTLLGGGILGALLFYLVSNTAAWWSNPEYPKTLLGWIQALTVGIPGYPPTWTFLRNTLLSGGLFTALMVWAMKSAEAPSHSTEEEEDEEGESMPEAEAEEVPS